MIVEGAKGGGRDWRGRSNLPSSGVMVSWKLSKSAGSGKLVSIVEGRSNSVKSVVKGNRISSIRLDERQSAE